MNRTLRRPMFRMGGTAAEGITSGLDVMPRQGYATNEDNLVKKNDFSKMPLENLGNMNMGQLRELSKSMAYKPRGTNVYDFMTEFGLDLLSRPRSGNIFQQAATSAKEPYQRFMERKQSAAEQQYGSESDMFKTLIGAQADILASEAEGAGKNWLEQWKFDQIPILNDIIRTLEPKRKDETIKPEDLAKLEDAIDQKARIVKLSEVASAWLKTEDGGFAVVDKKDELLREDQKLPEDERKYKSKKDLQLTIDAIDAINRELRAKGGRVGYQAGNTVMPGQPMQAQAPGPTDQGSEAPPEIQTIDYETLRARLPNTITDDIVRLIVSSAEAMEDFATIQTQQDISNFNKKYGVELILPAEA